MDLAPGHVGSERVEQSREHADKARLGLPAQPEKNEIVTRENGVHDLGHDCVVVAYDAGEDAGVIVPAQAGDEVVAEFVLDGTLAEFGL